VLAVLYIFAIGLEHGRVCPGLGKNFSQHRQVETESGAEAQTFREPSSVDVLEAVLRYELEQISKPDSSAKTKTTLRWQNDSRHSVSRRLTAYKAEFRGTGVIRLGLRYHIKCG
jgi:hypothetical protein